MKYKYLRVKRIKLQQTKGFTSTAWVKYNNDEDIEEELEYPIEILANGTVIAGTFDEAHAERIIEALNKYGEWSDLDSLDYDPDEESYTKEGMI